MEKKGGAELGGFSLVGEGEADFHTQPTRYAVMGIR